MAASPSVLGKVLEIFEENFRSREEIGASVSIWWDGVELLNEGHGWCEKEHTRPWTVDTLVPVYSATKVPSAATLLLALEAKGLGPGTLVREVWPAFPVAEATFAHLLSHQCGLAALDMKSDVFDHASIVAAIEAQTPAWFPGQTDGQGRGIHGYHPRTFGALVEEPVRRLTGTTLGNYWRQQIAAPLALDFWIGLPESEWPRVARLYPGKPQPEEPSGLPASSGPPASSSPSGNHTDSQSPPGEPGFYKQLATEGTYTRKAFSSPGGLRSIQEMNDPRAWSAGLPALGGTGTASALAKFYQVLIGSIPGPLSPAIRAALATPVSFADDRVLLRPTVFTCGAQMDPTDSVFPRQGPLSERSGWGNSHHPETAKVRATNPAGSPSAGPPASSPISSPQPNPFSNTPSGAKLRQIYGPSLAAFGHPGAGGSHAFGDPASGLSFAYTMNQMSLSVMPGRKCLDMVDALFSES